MHPRDNGRLLETLTQLRDMGNTVLVVEHDAETIERADYVIDLGPGAGRLGGVNWWPPEYARARFAHNSAILSPVVTSLRGPGHPDSGAARRKPGEQKAGDSRRERSTT